jgi:hypothetical protein
MNRPLSFTELLGRDFVFESTADPPARPPTAPPGPLFADRSFAQQNTAIPTFSDLLAHNPGSLYGLADNKQLAHVLGMENSLLFPSPPSTPMLDSTHLAASSLQQLASAQPEPLPHVLDSSHFGTSNLSPLNLDYARHSHASSIQISLPGSHHPRFDAMASMLSQSQTSSDLYLAMSTSCPSSSFPSLERREPGSQLILNSSSTLSQPACPKYYQFQATECHSPALSQISRSECGTPELKAPSSSKVFCCPRNMCSKVSLSC